MSKVHDVGRRGSSGVRSYLEKAGYYPQNCVWELTLRCNLSCRHCGSFAGRARDDELTGDELLRVAGELADLGCEHVTLSGGEPTLRTEWPQVARALAERGVVVDIISNGHVFDDELVELCCDVGLDGLGLSLDGFEDVHDDIRTVGSFRRVVATIARARAVGLPVTVVTHVNRRNASTLRELHDFLGQAGATAWQLQLGNPQGVMCEHVDLVLAPEDLLWLVPLVAELRRRTGDGLPRVDAGDNIGYFGFHERALRSGTGTLDFWTGCTAGCRTVGIESNGNVKGCLSLPSARHGVDDFVEGNLRSATLAEIWNRPGAFAYNRDFGVERLDGFCAECGFAELCRGGCSWTAQCHSGSRWNNPYCFHRVATAAGRQDLLIDAEPLVAAVRDFVAKL